VKECALCHRPFGATKRLCFACGRPILKNHKWHVVGCYIVHDDCQNPTQRPLVRTPAPSGAIPFQTADAPEEAAEERNAA
jgi:hypothetical protein